jgi:hypothetical protein
LSFFHIFHIFSLFSSVFSKFSILFHISTYFFSIFSSYLPLPRHFIFIIVSYNLIIFYELALSLVICPFPAILFS